MKKFYITTAIYYVNDVPHLGHALEVIGADVQARYMRMIGRDVTFLTGTDCHGQKVAEKAEKAGVSPEEWADNISRDFRDVFAALKISNDDFIMTTEPRHAKTVTDVWKMLVERGDIYFGEYTEWYDIKEEAFITETEMKRQGLQPDGLRIKRISEPAYFFRLSAYRDRLLGLYENNEISIEPVHRKNEIIGSFLESEVRDLCISRSSIEWGIPVPDAPGHVMYVWFDALLNYITGAGYGNDDFDKLWPCDCHVIGKDILKFHCVYWPAFLLAAGLPLPKRVFAHGFINVLRDGNQEKMSKSGGNVINPMDYVKTIGAEPLRYILMKTVSYGADGTFDEPSMISIYNAELPHGIGNIVSRVASLVQANIGTVYAIDRSEMTDVELSIERGWEALIESYCRDMEAFEYNKVLRDIADYRAMINQHINDVQPWKLAKDVSTHDRLRVFISCAAEAVCGIAFLLRPFMPESSESVLRCYGANVSMPWHDVLGWGTKLNGATVRKPEPIFPVIA